MQLYQPACLSDFPVFKLPVMKKILLLAIFFFALVRNAYAQFSASLAGYPLVTTGWNIGGFGTVVDSTVQLTSATANQNGYVYYNTPINLTACSQFTVKFDFKIVVSLASQVADGIAFWYIANPPSGFIAGGGIGLPSNPNGLLLIMDTYDNTAPVNVPLETLLGYNGSIAGYVEGSAAGLLAPVVGSQPFITDGAWHHVEMTYNTGTIKVYFNNSTTPSLTGTYPLGITGYFGLSASTGAAYSTQSVKNIHIDAAGVAPPPTVVSPVTYCQYNTAVPLTATGTAGSTISWFTTDTATVVSLPGAPTPNTSVVGTTTYYVRQGSGSCISAPDSIKVIVNPSPAAPHVAGVTSYCSGEAFVPFTVTGATGTVYWFTTATGGTGSTTAGVVNTAVSGNYNYWVGQSVAGCVGPRDSIKVRVKQTPAAPVVSGPLHYCVNKGPFVPLTVATTPTATKTWYTTATGGSGTAIAPTVNVATVGVYNYWVSQTDSNCEGPRTPVVITVHDKPAPPAVTSPSYCQYTTANPLTATGTSLLWYGPGITTGTPLAPTPTTTTPGTTNYYVTQTSAFGCISDSATDPVTIIAQPTPPSTIDTAFCQYSSPAALSAAGSNLKWYTVAAGGTALGGAPVPPTTAVGPTTWFVSQTVSGCESNRTPLVVNIIYQPQFTITASKDWVCLHDSISLAYTASGGPLTGPGYTWELPAGASLAAGTAIHQPNIIVKFDIDGNTMPVTLTATNQFGKCANKNSINIKVIPQPYASPYMNPDICLGDTVRLGLSNISSSAYSFKWLIDGNPFATSTALNIITHTNSFAGDGGGPFTVSWNQVGPHIIQLSATSEEGCKSEPVNDSVNVHMYPDASFMVAQIPGTFCIEDSVQFVAKEQGYEYAYIWDPARSFNNINEPTAWGRVNSVNAPISLTVVDPFGCRATTTQILHPDECCKVSFPTAFTPNGDVRNNIFRPIFAGYRRFHTFRILNRWGQVVFETTSNNPAWDGRVDGVPQDMGTYYFYIQYDCGGNRVEQKGDVTLVR